MSRLFINIFTYGNSIRVPKSKFRYPKKKINAVRTYTGRPIYRWKAKHSSSLSWQNGVWVRLLSCNIPFKCSTPGIIYCAEAEARSASAEGKYCRFMFQSTMPDQKQFAMQSYSVLLKCKREKKGKEKKQTTQGSS